MPILLLVSGCDDKGLPWAFASDILDGSRIPSWCAFLYHLRSSKQGHQWCLSSVAGGLPPNASSLSSQSLPEKVVQSWPHFFHQTSQPLCPQLVELLEDFGGFFSGGILNGRGWKLGRCHTFWSVCFADELLKFWQALSLHVENGGWPDGIFNRVVTVGSFPQVRVPDVVNKIPFLWSWYRSHHRSGPLWSIVWLFPNPPQLACYWMQQLKKHKWSESGQDIDEQNRVLDRRDKIDKHMTSDVKWLSKNACFQWCVRTSLHWWNLGEWTATDLSGGRLPVSFRNSDF